MTEQIDMEEVARRAFSSSFHFQRMFHALTDVTVAEYIRKRRLTLAAQELSMSSDKVLDIALKYGYESPESFAKAFRKVHGLSPSDARIQGVQLKAFPRISFHLSLKGDKDMEYRMAQFRMFGDEFSRSGFHLPGMNTLVDQKLNYSYLETISLLIINVRCGSQL